MGCSLECVRRLVTLACEARGALVVSWALHAQGYGGSASVVTADGTDVSLRVQAIGGRAGSAVDWTVSSECGSWDAEDYPDALCHAVALAIGDKP